jgi:EAL domain-containing protein (putative c-di-GMP-specific phosphodiesterase class I)
VRGTGGDGAVVGARGLFDGTPAAAHRELDWACRALHLRNFARQGDPGNLTLYLNVFPEAALDEAGDAREFERLIRYYGLAPARVCVEILQAGCADEGLLREAVASYRDIGVSIAMDDFGVGRSNLDRIVSLQPDVVKVDRTLLVDAMGDRNARRLLPALVALLHGAGSRVGAEGIESAQEALIALEAGVDYLQGWYYSRGRERIGEDTLSEQILAELKRMRATKRIAAVG